MINMLTSSAYFGVLITLGAYMIGLKIKEKTDLALMNPLLIGVVLVILLLSALHIDPIAYQNNTKLISMLLTPSTICLAVPLYEQLTLLKRHFRAMIIGIATGVLTSLLCVLTLSFLFHLDHAAYVTLLPKSITTAIGMGVCEQLGGYVPITVAIILITGILGNVIAEPVLRFFHISDPIARGIALGTSAHAIGTSKAMELGEIEGAMSSLSIVLAGILTVAGVSLFAPLL